MNGASQHQPNQGTEAGKINLLRPASFLTNAPASLALQPYEGY
jgi:hypothetical protein